MPRPELPVREPESLVGAFALQLREVRFRAGNPTYQKLAAKSGLAACTLSTAASGKRLPSLRVALGYVDACGEAPAPWEIRWKDTKARLKAETDVERATSTRQEPGAIDTVRIAQAGSEIAAAVRQLVDQVGQVHQVTDLGMSQREAGRQRKRLRVPGSTRHLAEVITCARGPVGTVSHNRIAKVLAGDPRHALDGDLVTAIVKCCHELCGVPFTKEDQRIWSRWIGEAGLS